MIDFDFAKCVVIALVALVVLGPQRLPYVARTAGALLGRAQRYFNQIKTEVAREIELEEIREMKGGLEQAAASLQDLFSRTARQTAHELNGMFVGDIRPTKSDTDANHSGSALAVANRSRMRRSQWRARQTVQPLWYKRAMLKRSRLTSSAVHVVPAPFKMRASLHPHQVPNADKNIGSRERSRIRFFV